MCLLVDSVGLHLVLLPPCLGSLGVGLASVHAPLPWYQKTGAGAGAVGVRLQEA